MGDGEYRDALPDGPARGRGAGLNPGNRFETVRLHVLGDHLDEIVSENPDGAQVRTRVYHDRTRTIINRVDSPDLGMQWTINPYRGCEHGCIYCYARPGHEYLGLSSGLDFETKILAKPDAPRLLRYELSKRSWLTQRRNDGIVMSGVTDPYQPVESRMRITRGCLEVLARFRRRITVITKNRLVVRDLDLLTDLARDGLAGVAVSLTSLDNHLASRMEPRASSPAERLRTIRELTDAGVPVTVMTAPIIPGLNDREIPALLKAASEAGARSAGYVLLRLPHQIKALFLDWLTRSFPERARHVESLIRQTRGGDLYDATPYLRRRGTGAFADQIRSTFNVFAKRYGLDGRSTPRVERRPAQGIGQLKLFDTT